MDLTIALTPVSSEDTRTSSCPSHLESLTSLSDSAAPSRRSATSSTKTSTPSIHKKSSSIFSFLKTKEPSTQAWLDYQESQCKQRAGRGGRLSAVGLPMVSSAKLPYEVPKVNSKWDGIPEGVAQREKGRKAANRENRKAQVKLPSFETSGSSSALSRSSLRSRNTDMYGHGTLNSVSSFDTQPTIPASAASSTPDLIWTPASIDQKDFASMLGNPTKSGPSTPLSELESFISYPPDTLRFQEEHKGRGSEDPPEIPKLPLVNAPFTPQYSRTLHGNTYLIPESTTKTIASDIQTTTLNVPSPRQVMLKTSGVSVLGPPVYAQRKGRVSSCNTDEAQGTPVSGPQASVSLKDSTPQWPPGSNRPALSSYPISTKSQGGTRGNSRVAPWKSSESDPILAPCIDVERSLTLTPQEQNGKPRKGRISFFQILTVASLPLYVFHHLSIPGQGVRSSKYADPF